MNAKSQKLTFIHVLIIFIILVTVLLFQQGAVQTVAAQTQGCTDPLTGAQCTDTPRPTCGQPGLPPCGGNPAPNTPTDTFRPRPTRTPSPTITPTPTSTITPIPTSTLLPTPTVKFNPPYVKQITNIIGGFHLPFDPSVIQLPSWMQPDNIKVTDIEITQAVQCLHNAGCPDNSVALYTGKVTLVRVYVKLTTGPDSSVYPIGGALCYGNTGAGGCSKPIRPVQKIFVENVADPVSYGRQVMSTTLDFILPMSYVQSATTQTLTVYANYNFEDLPSESYYKDNYKSIQYQVQASEPLYVRFYPVQDAGFFTPGLEWMKITNYLSLTYPTGEIYPSIGFPLLSKNYAWTVPDPWGCPKGWHDLISDLYYMRGGSGPVAYGEVPQPSLAGGVIGCGVLGGPEAAGIAGASTDGRVAAQEIGHTMNLPHVPGCGAGGADLSYPKPNGLLDEFGADPLAMIVYPPSSSYDFMGYCGGGSDTWTSIYTYNEIAGLLPEGAFLPARIRAAANAFISLQSPQFLLGSGELSQTSAKLTDGFYLLGKDSVGALTPDKGAYIVELQDVNSKVLYSQHFDVVQMSNANVQTEGGFQLVLPFTPGTHRIVFKYQDKVIGQVTASPHAPTVKLTSPADGAHWGNSGEQTISWKGSDVDGKPLSYLVQFSADNGKTWNVMAANLHDTSLKFDASFLPGGAQSLVRVFATDGLNTAQVVSGALTVDAKSPELAITAPQDSQSFDFGAPVVLHGLGADLKDGALTGDKLQWSSDKDGSLGTGATLVINTLSVGQHTISLSATNSDGLSTTVSVHVTINAVANTKAGSGSSLLSYLILGGLILILVAVIILVAKALSPRKKNAKAA
jgi:hypothetical protein